jgi:hypothetical protein
MICKQSVKKLQIFHPIHHLLQHPPTPNFLDQHHHDNHHNQHRCILQNTCHDMLINRHYYLRHRMVNTDILLTLFRLPD